VRDTETPVKAAMHHMLALSIITRVARLIHWAGLNGEVVRDLIGWDEGGRIIFMPWEIFSSYFFSFLCLFLSPSFFFSFTYGYTECGHGSMSPIRTSGWVFSSSYSYLYHFFFSLVMG